MAAAAVAGQGVNLVDDDRVHVPQGLAGPLGGEHQVEGLWGGDEDVGRAGDEGAAARGLGVAGADADANLGERLAARLGQFADGSQGCLKIAFDVVAQGLERRDVDDAGDRIESLFLAAADELVDPDQEGGQGLAGSGWGRDEGVAPGADGGPGGGLGVGGRCESRDEPVGHEGMKRRDGGVVCRGGGSGGGMCRHSSRTRDERRAGGGGWTGGLRCESWRVRACKSFFQKTLEAARGAFGRGLGRVRARRVDARWPRRSGGEARRRRRRAMAARTAAQAGVVRQARHEREAAQRERRQARPGRRRRRVWFDKLTTNARRCSANGGRRGTSRVRGGASGEKPEAV